LIKFIKKDLRRRGEKYNIGEFLLSGINGEMNKLAEENKAITICPELLGGFSTPREPAEIIGGNGEDVLEWKGKNS
jgi:uncharacterized protein YbbK (DUF523 family)